MYELLINIMKFYEFVNFNLLVNLTSCQKRRKNIAVGK